MEPTSRRTYLTLAVKLLFLLGLILLSIPFFASLQSPQQADGRQNSPWHVEVGLQDIAAGTIKKVNWPAGEVWIYRRTLLDLQHLARPVSGLRDPDSRASEQPASCQNNLRSLSETYFVFIPNETRRGCLVNWDEAQQQFVEPCHGARFDAAGRIYGKSGHPRQQNLRVPNYHLLSAQRIRLLPPGQ